MDVVVARPNNVHVLTRPITAIHLPLMGVLHMARYYITKIAFHMHRLHVEGNGSRGRERENCVERGVTRYSLAQSFSPLH